MDIQVPESARDLRVNIKKLLDEDSTSELQRPLANAIALASALSLGHAELAELFSERLQDEGLRRDAETAAALMAMTNVYYRFTHVVDNEAYGRMPAQLRMQGLAQAASDKVALELMSLAVSAINGCAMCMNSHERTLVRHGVREEVILEAVRIGAVVNGLATAMQMREAVTA